MNEFVTMCGRDRLPIIWVQDTSGIDVGDIAEKAELLGLGQSLIYSIEQTDVPMMLIVLRKGTAAAHYVMGGPRPTTTTPSPWAPPPPRSTSCTARRRRRPRTPPARERTRIRQAARRHDQEDERDREALRGVLAALLLREERLRRRGGALRGHAEVSRAFANCVWQNPTSICPQHHMMLPRIIQSQIVTASSAAGGAGKEGCSEMMS